MTRGTRLVRTVAWAALGAGAVGLTAGSLLGVLPIALDEVFGFTTGAACVLLVVDESVWNFPVGIANNALFLVLFARSRLFGDMSLQLVYLALGGLGWWQWTRFKGGAAGEAQSRDLRITRASNSERWTLLLFAIAATPPLRSALQWARGAAPFLDAFTTVLSLVAQWLLNRKRMENWYVWIAADVIYVYLYLQRHLPLTALLYALFIPLCIAGLVRWRALAAPDTAPGATA